MDKINYDLLTKDKLDKFLTHTFSNKMATRRQRTLEKLAKEYGTDKLDHGYLPYYANELPLHPEKFLEIGCYKGASVQMWKKFFGDKTQVHTFDLFKEFPYVKTEMEEKGIICYAGNQHEPNDLYQAKEMFDVIISDGSHYPGLEQITFYHLFINNLQPGGTYFLEDAHTSIDMGWWDEGVSNFQDTILSFFMKYADGEATPTKFIGEHELNILKQHIQSVEVVCDNKLVIITKKE